MRYWRGVHNQKDGIRSANANWDSVEVYKPLPFRLDYHDEICFFKNTLQLKLEISTKVQREIQKESFINFIIYLV